jgi:putative membrane protein
MKMFKPKRLHPIAIVSHFGKGIKDSVISLFAILFIGGKGGGGIWAFLIPSAIVIVFLLISSILSWVKHTYLLDEKELKIEQGVFIRKKRYIPFERIQSIDMTEGLLQRLFGLVKVRIETAGGNLLEGSEAVLSAISKQDAKYIQESFMMAKDSVSPTMSVDEHQPFYQITPIQLLLLSITSGGIGVVISGVFAVLLQFDNVIPFEKLFGNAEKLAANSFVSVLILVFAGFLLLWVIAFFRMMLKYANFTVKKADTDLIISQGLFERRQMTVPLKRIQVVRMDENIFLQLLGYATVYIVSAGGSLEYKDGAKVMLIPALKRKQIPEILNRHLPDYRITDNFCPPPKIAMIRYMLRTWYWTVPIMIVSVVYLKVWGLFSLFIVAAFTLLAFSKYHDAGWNLDHLQLSFRWRTFGRSTVYMKKNRIQSLKVSESFLQRRNQLATVEAFVKTGTGHAGGNVKDLSLTDIETIYSWYSNEKRG